MTAGAAERTPAALYLDSSATVKLVREERESAALRAFLATSVRPLSSALVVTETLRAAMRPEGPTSRLMDEARAVIDRLVLIDISRAILNEAGLVPPDVLRSLDAIHLASALSLRPHLAGIVTYDDRLETAARQHNVLVFSPGR